MSRHGQGMLLLCSLLGLSRTREVGQLTRVFQMMLAGLHQWEVMHDTFSRYLSQEVVEASNIRSTLSYAIQGPSMS